MKSRQQSTMKYPSQCPLNDCSLDYVSSQLHALLPRPTLPLLTTHPRTNHSHVSPTCLGLAAGLMEEVQRQMECHHGGEAVSLHVRCSNDAALRLYGPNGLGYRIEKTIDVRGLLALFFSHCFFQ